MSLTIDKLNQWNECLSDALIEVGSDVFAPRLVDALHQLVDFDVCMVFAYGKSQGSVALHHNMSGNQAKLLVDDYLLGPHLLDPFFAEATSGRTRGFCSMRDLAPDQFYQSEFYQHHYVRTGIKDEIGILFPVNEERVAVLSITRQDNRSSFSDQDKKIFASATPLIEKFGSKHWGAMTSDETSRTASTSIDEVFEKFGEDILTEREREIVALILKGHSSVSMSYILDITEGTVKIHRKNAYSKLGVVSQADLFARFLKLLQKKLDR